MIQLVTKGILKYCLIGLCVKAQREFLFYFLDALTELLAPEIARQNLTQIELRVHLSLARLERDFPVSIQVHVSGWNVHSYDSHHEKTKDMTCVHRLGMCIHTHVGPRVVLC